MKVILRRVESVGDLHMASDEFLDTDRVTIGRGTDQHIQLPDMRLSLEHSEIREVRSGEFVIESKTLTGAWVNGTPAPLHDLNAGDVIDCGRFRITVGPAPPDADLLLEVVERVSARDEKAQRGEHFLLGLTKGGLRMRRPAWVLGGAVLLLALALPLLLRYGFPGASAGASLDLVWETGPRSSAHARFQAECSACHQTPFRPVANDACGACHSRTALHSHREELNAVPTLGEARCAGCHLEHSGAEALRASADDSCTGCHAHPDRHFPGAGLSPVTRFSTDHPPFTPTLPRYQPGSGMEFRAVAMADGARLEEHTNLVFPHDAHLDPRGLRGPDGTRVLECADCHKPAGRGESFKPVQMTEHCASCHRLDFDPDDPARVVPHAKPAEVVRIIQDYFSRQALAGEVRAQNAPDALRLRRVPGEALSGEQRRVALEWADARAAQVVSEVFTRRVCATCHIVEPPPAPAGDWHVAPVALTQQYLTGARFDHAAHRTEDCSACHDAPASTDSASLMLPDLASCQTCHGDPGQSQVVPSACASCHTFHLSPHPAPASRSAGPLP